jgi:hypothetical protein
VGDFDGICWSFVQVWGDLKTEDDRGKFEEELEGES